MFGFQLWHCLDGALIHCKAKWLRMIVSKPDVGGFHGLTHSAEIQYGTVKIQNALFI